MISDSVAAECIADGADVNAPYKGVLPVDAAGFANNGHMVRFLVKNGARPTMHAAAGIGDNELILQLIKEGCPVDQKNTAGETPLVWAARNGHPDTIRLLAKRGADLRIRLSDGSMLLHVAAEADRDTVIECLVSLGIKPDVKNSEGHTPLYYAICYGELRENAARCLLELGADVNSRDDDGETVFHRVGSTDAVNFLLQHGADPNALDKYGTSPLRMAAFRHKEDVESELIRGGVKEDLFAAAHLGHCDVAAQLIAAGADVNEAIRDRNGCACYPLHLAVSAGHSRMVALLVSKGARVNVRDSTSSTPLMLAASAGNVDIVRYLMSHGADRRAVDCSGMTAAERAQWAGHTEISLYLKNPMLMTVVVVAAVLVGVVALARGLWWLFFVHSWPSRDTAAERLIPMKHSMTDALLIYAIGEASKDGPASLEDVIGASDPANHSVFTYDEIEQSLPRMMQAGLVEYSKGRFSLGLLIAAKYTALMARPRLRAYDPADLEHFFSLCAEPPGPPPPCVVTKEDYDAAVRQYLESIHGHDVANTRGGSDL